jgi:hypothetical protein
VHGALVQLPPVVSVAAWRGALVLVVPQQLHPAGLAAVVVVLLLLLLLLLQCTCLRGCRQGCP